MDWKEAGEYISMIYNHYSEVPWDKNRWPNFSPNEKNIYCPCCGEFYLDENSFDTLQRLRDIVNKPIKINSGHRCFLYNYLVGGVPRSMHKKIAFDISLKGHNKKLLLEAAKKAGFNGFGFYVTFIHLDLGRPRRWASKGGLAIWNGLI